MGRIRKDLRMVGFEMQSVGIIGNGFVGGSIAKAFAEDYIIKVYDINKDRSLNSFEGTVKCDFVFVCLQIY